MHVNRTKLYIIQIMKYLNQKVEIYHCICKKLRFNSITRQDEIINKHYSMCESGWHVLVSSRIYLLDKLLF